MEKVHIAVSPAYDVKIGAGILERAGQEIAAVLPSRHTLIVTESNVAPLYLEQLERSLEQEGIRADHWIFPAGEESKNWQVLGDLLQVLMDKELTRGDFLIALGGGVTGDLTGFAASIYLRGIPFVQIPTTLLAAVDSSVGGKTAVNLGTGKNQAGTFWQPRLVLMDPEVLKTLPGPIFRAGVAESIKYGILRDRRLFDAIASGAMEKAPESLIAACIAMKGLYVEEDERDIGARQFLNLGHTFAHGIEAESQFAVSHGYAVAMGMCLAARIGAQVFAERSGAWGKNMTSDAGESCEAEIRRALSDLGLPTECPYTAEQLLPHMGSDKKRKGDRITLVLPRQIGYCELVSVTLDELEKLLQGALSQ